MKKMCSTCRIEKDINKFHRAKNGKGGRQGNCMDCNTLQAQSAEWKKAQIDIDHDTYVQMSSQQDGRCAICGERPTGKRLAVDHDHESKAVRKLLCMSCNTGIGKFKDKPELLRKAANYLDSFSSTKNETAPSKSTAVRNDT